MPRSRLSLYQCGNALCGTQGIYCDKLHKITPNGGEYISFERLMRGDRLEINTCQNCRDIDYLGDPILEGERGWLNKEAI